MQNPCYLATILAVKKVEVCEQLQEIRRAIKQLELKVHLNLRRYSVLPECSERRGRVTVRFIHIERENIIEIHRRAEGGDEETIKKILKNTEDAINYHREEAWTTFWYLWYDWIVIASRYLYQGEKVQRLIRLLRVYDKWYGILRGIPISIPDPEDFMDECIVKTFEKLSRARTPFTVKGYTVSGYRKLKNYLRKVIDSVMVDKIRQLLKDREPTPLELEKELRDLPDDLQSMKDEAVDIFADEERYQRVLQMRWLSEKSHSLKLERMKYYYEIVRRSLKGESSEEIKQRLLRHFGFLPKGIYGLKREAFEELWINICIDEKFHELEYYIICKVILNR